MEHYDIVVIGAGSGGITAAINGVGFGKKVLLVDRSKPGGECTWSGCVPSKALIHEAGKVHVIRQRVPNFSYDTREAPGLCSQGARGGLQSRRPRDPEENGC